MVSVYGAMTHERKARIWQLWRQGRPMIDIARDIVKPSATVYSYLLYHGEMEPRERVRDVLIVCLSKSMGSSLEAWPADLATVVSLKRQAVLRQQSVEEQHNGGDTRYRASVAEKAFLGRSKRPKPLLLADNPALRMIVTYKLESDWSPEQISGQLKHHSPDGKEMYVSHETIYKSLFIQTRGIFREELKKQLRTKRMFRHAKSHKTAYGGQTVDAILIRKRPTEIEDRAIPGHWKVI